MELPKRKDIHLREYDYSRNGAYFVTVCTENRAALFARQDICAETVDASDFDDVGADPVSARIIRKTFAQVVNEYPSVSCPKYVIMPDHFHALIVLERADTGSAPTLHEIVQSFKRFSTTEYIKAVKAGSLPPFSKRIWQRGYYEHVIRSYEDFLDCWTYIENNPLKSKETHK